MTASVPLITSGDRVCDCWWPRRRWNGFRNAVAGGLLSQYKGYATAWYSLAHGAVPYYIEVTTVDEWIVAQLGLDPRQGLDHADWLGLPQQHLPQQHLLQVTRGGVFHDDAGELTRIRELLICGIRLTCGDGCWLASGG